MSDNQKSFAERFASKSSVAAGGSNAEKYASKSNFTSTKVEDSNASNSIQTSSNLKQVDPQKKMQAELIYLVKGVDANRNAWYYVLVERLKVQLFLKALNDEIIHLENYGKILFSAYGDEPPADITNALKEEYGIQ